MATQGHAETPSEATTSDVRCLVVSLNLADSADESIRRAALVSFQYFLGRLDGREPQLDLEQRLTAEVLRMSDEELRAQATVCGDMLVRRGREVGAIGRRIEDRGRANQGGA